MKRKKLDELIDPFVVEIESKGFLLGDVIKNLASRQNKKAKTIEE